MTVKWAGCSQYKKYCFEGNYVVGQVILNTMITPNNANYPLSRECPGGDGFVLQVIFNSNSILEVMHL